jgi:hypothetical protein
MRKKQSADTLSAGYDEGDVVEHADGARMAKANREVA